MLDALSDEELGRFLQLYIFDMPEALDPTWWDRVEHGGIYANVRRQRAGAWQVAWRLGKPKPKPAWQRMPIGVAIDVPDLCAPANQNRRVSR